MKRFTLLTVLLLTGCGSSDVDNLVPQEAAVEGRSELFPGATDKEVTARVLEDPALSSVDIKTYSSRGEGSISVYAHDRDGEPFESHRSMTGELNNLNARQVERIKALMKQLAAIVRDEPEQVSENRIEETALMLDGNGTLIGEEAEGYRALVAKGVLPPWKELKTKGGRELAKQIALVHTHPGSILAHRGGKIVVERFPNDPDPVGPGEEWDKLPNGGMRAPRAYPERPDKKVGRVVDDGKWKAGMTPEQAMEKSDGRGYIPDEEKPGLKPVPQPFPPDPDPKPEPKPKHPFEEELPTPEQLENGAKEVLDDLNRRLPPLSERTKANIEWQKGELIRKGIVIGPEE